MRFIKIHKEALLFKQPLTADLDQSINVCHRSVYLCGYATILCLVKTGLKHTVRVLEPCYSVPSCMHVTLSMMLLCIN